MGRPHLNLFWGTVPTVTPKSPPMYVCLSLSSLPKFPNHQFPTMTLDNNCARLHIGLRILLGYV